MDQIVKNITKNIIRVTLFSTLVVFSTCKKADDTVNLKFTDTTVSKFSNPYDAILFAAYPLIETYSNQLWIYLGFLSDEFKEQNFEYPVSYNFSAFNDIWNQDYRSIFLTGEFIDYIDNSSLSIDEKDKLKGEAYFYMSLAYFDLVRLFGKFYPLRDKNEPGVPILLSGNSEERISRASVKDVYEKIVSGLNQASTLLPEERT
jgi:hypothetical protein